jgi:hypothetical protein
MDTSGISSRPVTLRIIKNLLDKKVIKKDRKKPNAQSRLIINPEFDFKDLELNYLILILEQVKEWFYPIRHETKGVNTQLIRELQQIVIDFRKKEEIYTPKQLEKFESDYQKKVAKQLVPHFQRMREKLHSKKTDFDSMSMA